MLPRLDLTLKLAPGETLWTENSHKLSRASTRAMLHAAGLQPKGWYTDPAQHVALAPAGPARAAAATTRAA